MSTQKIGNLVLEQYIKQIYLAKVMEIYREYSPTQQVVLKEILDDYQDLKICIISDKNTCRSVDCCQISVDGTKQCETHRSIVSPVDLDKYVQTKKVVLNGKKYLQDPMGILYDPVKYLIVGRFVDNMVHKYT